MAIALPGRFKNLVLDKTWATSLWFVSIVLHRIGVKISEDHEFCYGTLRPPPTRVL